MIDNKISTSVLANIATIFPQVNRNDLQLLEILHNSEDTVAAFETAVKIITDFLKQHESYQ